MRKAVGDRRDTLCLSNKSELVLALFDAVFQITYVFFHLKFRSRFVKL